MITCKNCEFTFEGKFCPNCSQKANTHRFSLGHFGHELFHAVTHTDKGILFLIRELFLRPGKVAAEYVEGKRKKYFNPLTFLLIMMAMQVITMKKTDIQTSFINATEKLVSNLAKRSPDIKLEDARKSLEEGKVTTKVALENNKLLNFAMIPFLAFLTWLLFKKAGYNYTENLVFNVLIMGQITFYFLIVCIIPFLIYPGIVILVYYLYILITWIYSFIAYKQFFKQRWSQTIFKGIVIQILYIVAIQQFINLLVLVF